jgi:hypothetical protein
MKDKKPIEQAIQRLESSIGQLRDSLKDWENRSLNRSGANEYKEKAKRYTVGAGANQYLIR